MQSSGISFSTFAAALFHFSFVRSQIHYCENNQTAYNSYDPDIK